MKLFRRFKELLDNNTEAAQRSRQVLDQANRHGAEAEQSHEVALQRLEVATAQAARLSAADQRNHYSESLTHSFRGRTA